jgi:hypothetical protein
MPIKLFNKTPYDDEVLQQFLSFAHRAMGLKGTTAVKVTCNQTMHCSGEAHDGQPYLWHLKPKRVAESRRYTIPKGIDYGYVVLKIPHPKALVPGFVKDIASEVLSVALHEFAHVKDYRTNSWTYRSRQFNGTTTPSGRRVAWNKRPCEISAIDQTDEVLRKIQRNPRREALLNELVAEFEARATEARILPDKSLEILKTLARDDSARIIRRGVNWSLRTSGASILVPKKTLETLRSGGFLVYFSYFTPHIETFFGITEKGRAVCNS